MSASLSAMRAILWMLGGALGIVLMGMPAARAEEGDPEWLDLVTPTSRFEIGLLGVAGGSPGFSDATGLDARGARLDAGFDLTGQAPHDGLDTTRWRLFGRHIGLDNREFALQIAEQGTYRLSLNADWLTRHGPDRYLTPFIGAGGTRLTLPEGLVQATSNAQTGAAALTGAMRPVGLELERRRSRASAQARIAQGWEFKASLREDRQTGTRASGATLGTGGNSVAMILPEPVDSVTRSIEAGLAYQVPGSTLEIRYLGSFYDNHVDGYVFQSPFAIPNTLPDNRMGTAPDNQAHRISLNGAHTFGPRARLTASASYGRLGQNDDFLPYSTATGAPVPPRASLDAEVVTRQVRVKFAGRPMRELRVNASYLYDGRDNRTPIAEYTLPGISLSQFGEVGAANATIANTPYSRATRRIQLDAGYAAGAGRDLSLFLSSEAIERNCHDAPDCVEVPRTDEQAWRMEWRQDVVPGIRVRLMLGNAIRRGDDYQRYAESVELAGMRKFFLADRQRSQLDASLNADLAADWNLGIRLNANRDSYERSPYGLRSARNQAVNLELGYNLDNDLHLVCFAGRETYRSRLASSYASTQTIPGVTDELPGAQWEARLDDAIDTLGMSLTRKGLLDERLDLEGGLILVRARSPYDVVGGPYSAGASPVPPVALPVVESDSLQVRLAANYRLGNEASLRLAYLHSRLRGDDYALDLYGVGTVPRLLGTEERSPRHHGHAISIAYARQFR